MLIIVESPAKAKTIRNILGKNYTVEASVGHIRRITNDKKTKDGRKLEINGIDIEKGYTAFYEVDPDKKQVVTKLKKLAKDNKNQILFATDSDREGEAISWHLAEILGIKDKTNVQRLEFHEITDGAIKHALSSPRPLNTQLVEAQQARQVLDKMVGYKLSPVLWSTMNNRKLSAGRVQSPALVLIYQREQEIKNFKPVNYFEVQANFVDKSHPIKIQQVDLTKEKEEKLEQLPFNLKKLEGNIVKKEAIKPEHIQQFTDRLIKDNLFVVQSILKSKVKNSPKPPFTTSTLQQAASSRLGFSPKQTMRLAQKLYEGVIINGKPTALITYMRTDSTNLSQESIAAIRKHVSTVYPQFVPAKPVFYRSKSKNAQEAHEAIRPTQIILEPSKIKNQLESAEYKLYDLIWRQTIACQMTAEIRELTTVEVQNSAQDGFSGSVSKQLEAGYKAVLGSGEDKNFDFDFREHMQVWVDKLNIAQKQTQPPARYSPASLIKKLEELGIGRPSTYASIISTLHDRTYVEDNNKSMIPTDLGLKIAQILVENFEDVSSSKMTAKMEDELDAISRGENNYKQVLDGFWPHFKKEVENKSESLYQDKTKYRHVDSEKIDNPKGSGKLVLKIGRFGKYWQSEEDPTIIFPENFRELEVAEREANQTYGQKVKGLISPVSKQPLIVRVNKTKLTPYISTADFRPMGKERAISIEKLNELGWTQETVDQIYTSASTKTKSTRFKPRKKFIKKIKGK